MDSLGYRRWDYGYKKALSSLGNGYLARIQTKNRGRIYDSVVVAVSKGPVQVHVAHFRVIPTLMESVVSSGSPLTWFAEWETDSRSQLGPFPAVLHQCHPDSTIGEQNSDQSLHLRMETDSHNQRHKNYRGTCCTVTTATGHAGGGGWEGGWGGIIISSLRLAVGGLVQWFSLVGCSALWETQKAVSRVQSWSGGSRFMMGIQGRLYIWQLKAWDNHMEPQKKHVWFNDITATSEFTIKEASCCFSVSQVCLWYIITTFGGR